MEGKGRDPKSSTILTNERISLESQPNITKLLSPKCTEKINTESKT